LISPVPTRAFSYLLRIETTIYDTFFVAVFKSLRFQKPFQNDAFSKGSAFETVGKPPLSSAFSVVLGWMVGQNAPKGMRFHTK